MHLVSLRICITVLWPLLQIFLIGSTWIIPKQLVDLHPLLADEIAKTIVSTGKDRLMWSASNDGDLPLEDAYHFVNTPSNPLKQWKLIWSSSIPPSKSFTSWRLIKDRMPTDENLTKRGCYIPSRCNMCCSNSKTSDHLFLTCPFAVSLWNWLGTIFST